MCLSDPYTAVLIGGETTDQRCCADPLWKLELGRCRRRRCCLWSADGTRLQTDALLFPDNDFWYPMNSSGPAPPCTRGHSATYDPDSKAVYVYGGLREGQRYSELFVLSTVTWKWKLVTVGLLDTAIDELLEAPALELNLPRPG